ncbi:MAG: LD-carboxypeptidase [Alphaproteobacteria bacterium]|nr:LD-carboxypeptidase [Alphaproteobacteria bacterium]
MQPLFPSKLKLGDEIRVISPSRTMGIISSPNKLLAIKALEDLGLRITFGQHVDEHDVMHSSSVESRLTDLHEAFADPDVKGILTVIGGYNSNQLLESLDYDLIRENPKIFCGFSDITALGNAIYHKTGLVTYSGLHFSSFAMQKGFEYSYAYFKKIFFELKEIFVVPSKEWSEDTWYLDQENRIFHPNSGYKIINPGQAQGKIIGGNLGTLQLLRGTPFMPSLEGAILFLEEVSNASGIEVYEFDRNLQSLIQAPDFKKVRAIILGRFENTFGMTDERLHAILTSKPALKSLPLIANADFGHTTPIFTFPIGGICHLRADESGKVELIIEKH